MTATLTARVFKIHSPNGVTSMIPKLARCIEDTVNEITKEVEVTQMNVTQFDNYFLVRRGPKTAKLLKEMDDYLVEHIVTATLICDSLNKKLLFDVWQKIKASEVLK